MRVSLLGGVGITGTGTTLSARALALLAYLVTHSSTPQPRGHLADVLWPDSDSGQARTNLRRELHHLRGALGEDGGLEVTTSALTWQPGRGTDIDVERFLSARSRALAAMGDGEDVRPHLTRALDAYRGDFLPGCYDDWALAVRAELQTACVELCDQGADHHEDRGELEAAIALTRRRIGLEPLEEPGYRRLMRLQHETDDRAGALRTYHRCASLLEQELGVVPSLETRRELDALLADARAPAPSGPDSTRSDPAPTGPVLVGRDRERSRLWELWTTRTTGVRTALVAGEAGVGKTRLAADLAARVRAAGGRVVTARCFEATQGLPLAPVAEWLRDPQLRAATARLDPVWQAEVNRLVPEGEDESLADSARAKVDAWQRLRFFEGLARAVLAVDRPLLLVVDDLQWGDSATISWLSFLMSYPTAAPVLVVATARDDEHRTTTTDPLAALRAGGQVVPVALSPLTYAATVELANALVGHPLGDDETTLVHSVAAGNPFFVIEALREAQVAPRPVQPAHLEAVLTSRLSRLSETARSVTGLAAAVGRDFGLDLLIEASDLDPDTVVQVVDELWRRRILDQRGLGYDFAHSLLREAAYHSVPPARRWLVHRRLAQALELLYRDRENSVAAELAEQYDRSGQPERALPFYDRAARNAAAVFANAEAVRLWQRCWDLLDVITLAGRDRAERQLVVIEQLLPPLNAWKGYASVDLESYERRAYELGRRLDLVEAQATAGLALFATTFVQGHTAESLHWGLQALELTQGTPHLAAQAHMATAGPALSLGRVQLACDHFAQAVSLAGETDSLPLGTRTGVHALAWWAHGRWLAGDPAGAQEACERAVLRARTIEHPYSLAVALAYAAVTSQLLGDRARLATVLDELTAVCRRYEFAYYGEWALVLSGWLQGGPLGIEQAVRGIHRLEGEGSLARMPYWLWLLADLHRQAGDTIAAVGVLDAAHSFAVHHEDVWWLPEVLRSRAALDPSPGAVRGLERALKLAHEQGSVTLEDRCRAALTTQPSSLV